MRRLMEELMTRKMWEKNPSKMLQTGKPPRTVSLHRVMSSMTVRRVRIRMGMRIKMMTCDLMHV
jgi:hypothetical protein